MPQLSIPPAVTRDPAATEITRIWLANEQQTFILDVRAIDDPAAWGLFAVDLMKHAARAYEQLGRDKEETYQRILAGFMAEMESPTEEL